MGHSHYLPVTGGYPPCGFPTCPCRTWHGVGLSRSSTAAGDPPPRGFPMCSCCTWRVLWVSPAAPLPWVAILHVGFPRAFAAHGVLWVSPAAPLPRVALFQLGIPRADSYPHLRVGLLVHLLIRDCGQMPNKVSKTLATTPGALLSILKSPVKGTSLGLSPGQ